MSPNKQPLTICFVAGKSGGHILPCITLAQQWQQAKAGGTVIFVSTDTPLDQALTTSPVITKNYYIPLTGVPYRSPQKFPLFLYQFARALGTSFSLLRTHRPTKIVSTGSHIAIPVIIAAYILRIPIELWELNEIPGRTIKLLARFATTINICFAGTQKYFSKKPCAVVPYPLRYKNHEKISQEEALKKINFGNNRTTIFILGGSQGSASLNTIIKELVNKFADVSSKIQCIHQTGSYDQTDWKSWYTQHNIPAQVFAYQNNLIPYFCAADIVLSRAGAGAIFEIDFFEKTGVLVPLKTKQTSHQIDNAHAYAHAQPERVFVCTNEQEAPQKLYQLLKNN